MGAQMVVWGPIQVEQFGAASALVKLILWIRVADRKFGEEVGAFCSTISGEAHMGATVTTHRRIYVIKVVMGIYMSKDCSVTLGIMPTTFQSVETALTNQAKLS